MTNAGSDLGLLAQTAGDVLHTAIAVVNEAAAHRPFVSLR